MQQGDDPAGEYGQELEVISKDLVDASASREI
jgi:hypothetical protein